MIYNNQAFWRETMKPARFLMFDARLVIFVAIFLLHIQVWTGLLLTAAAIIFTVCEKVLGLDFNNLLRWVRAFFAGRHRSARGRHAPRHAVDFAFEMRPEHRRRLQLRQERAKAARTGQNNKASTPSSPGWLSKLGLSRS